MTVEKKKIYIYQTAIGAGKDRPNECEQSDEKKRKRPKSNRSGYMAGIGGGGIALNIQ